jgi:hypothetical protein
MPTPASCATALAPSASQQQADRQQMSGKHHRKIGPRFIVAQYTSV